MCKDKMSAVHQVFMADPECIVRPSIQGDGLNVFVGLGLAIGAFRFDYEFATVAQYGVDSN